MRPVFIPTYIKQNWENDLSVEEKQEAIKKAHASLLKGPPNVSIVIPAYNEEANILQTLLSLSNNITRFSVEIIVVNNNSKDNTEKLVRASGVICVNEMKQGITAARTAGLMAAKGKYILNADADTIYPQRWVELMSAPLENDDVAMTYGRFSFIPVGKTGRLVYFFYEYFADLIKFLDGLRRDEAVNVYGFNSGFRREQGIEVDGYQHPPGNNEDGYLAMKLRNKGFGKLFRVSSAKALAWTSDRRIQSDGGLWAAIGQRFQRFFSRSKEVYVRDDL